EYQLEKNSANEDENSVLPIEPIKESDADCNNDSMNLNEILKKTEKELIEKALALSKGNKNEAASILGIPRQTLKYKIDKLQE
ncbi:MAG: helix-turn-helix domain-containing protein, partial [Oscillospiraceae bacterium]